MAFNEALYKIIVFLSIMALVSCEKKSQSFDTMHDAYESGDLSDIRAFIKENPNAINDKDEHGNTVLLLSIYDRNDELAKYLIDSGAEVNLVNQVKVSPLQMACMNKDYAMAR